jgi:hypothetical protein
MVQRSMEGKRRQRVCDDMGKVRVAVTSSEAAGLTAIDVASQ